MPARQLFIFKSSHPNRCSLEVTLTPKSLSFYWHLSNILDGMYRHHQPVSIPGSLCPVPPSPAPPLLPRLPRLPAFRPGSSHVPVLSWVFVLFPPDSGLRHRHPEEERVGTASSVQRWPSLAPTPRAPLWPYPFPPSLNLLHEPTLHQAAEGDGRPAGLGSGPGSVTSQVLPRPSVRRAL